MKIAGITTCVDYADHLARSLPLWRDGLDRLIVVTSDRDADTAMLCIEHGVRFHCTDAFYRDGAVFNKSGAMQEAIGMLPWQDWFLFFDADVIPPADWRQRVESACPLPNSLHGASRRHENGIPIHDGELAGFFNLFHSDDPAVETRPLLGSWHNASGYDSQFTNRWPKEFQRILPIELTHVGDSPGVNWCGRGNLAGAMQMRIERANRGGYTHERIT